MTISNIVKTAAYVLLIALLQFVLVSCSPNVDSETQSPSLVPQNVTAIAGAGQIILSWDVDDSNSASTVVGYNIYMASQSGVSPGNYSNLADGRKITVYSSAYTITCLDPNKIYYFVITSRVVTYIGDIPYLSGESSPSAEVSAKPKSTTIANASAPTGLVATAGVNSVSLSWDANAADECIDSYTVYMATAPWITWVDTLPGALRTTNIKYTSFNQGGLDNGTTYWFAVTASNYQGESAESAQVSATPESIPSSISFDLNGDNKFTDSSDVMIPGVTRTYKSVIKNQINAPMQGVTVNWESSDTTIAGINPMSSVTDENGIATTSVSSLNLGGATITATDADSNISKSVTLDVASPLSNISAVTAGDDHTCAMTSIGGAKCWGSNDWGKLGDGWVSGSSDVPVDVVGVESGISAITVASEHSCAIALDGSAKCWGNNNFGQLGRDDVLYSSIAVNVMGIAQVSAISAGGEHTCALTTTGGVKCWGDNYYGELGDGTYTGSYSPVDVVGLGSGVSAISAGIHHTCAITTSGGVKCWGNNYNGQLGDGSTTASTTPVDVVGLTSGVVAISSGGYHTCALTSAGAVKCWGYNYFGQLGNGSTANSLTPVTVASLASGVSAVSAGVDHSCAVTTAGGAKCWGYNTYAQLGDGTTTDSSTPVDVVGLGISVNTISAGREHTCAVTTAGGVKCWGRNLSGRLGDGTTLDRFHPVDVISQ